MYIPIGPTGRMNAIFSPRTFALRISFAISWPIFVSNSVRSPQGTGSNALFQNFCGLQTSSGLLAQIRSIFLMSQPFG